MTGRLWLAVACAALVAACGSPTPTPPPTAAPSATPDPRLADLTKQQGAWDKLRPRTVAYTTVETAGPSTSSVRVTEMDGRAEAQAVALGSQPPPIGPDQSVLGIFDRATAALAGSAPVSVTYDQAYGYIASLVVAGPDPTAAAPAWSVAVTDLVTPADRRSAAQARDALDDLLRAWAAPPSAAWEYTWSRYTAADTPATATTWVVRSEADGTTTASAGPGSTGTAADGSGASIRGTVETAIGVLAAGGWVDVAMDPATLDTLIAIDPSPSVAGDAYWIRIDVTDVSMTQAREALQAARTRWAAAALIAYRYTWRWQDADGTWTYKVTVKAGVATVKPGRGAPPAAEAPEPPRIDGLFDAIGASIDAGLPFAVTYDETLGYPKRIEVPGATDAPPRGVVTIAGFRRR